MLTDNGTAGASAPKAKKVRKASPRKRRSGGQKTNVITEKSDVYRLITDRIIVALENGTPPWKRPWRNAQKGVNTLMPSNAFTGREYSGVNVLLLWLAAEERGFHSDRWLTYNQALEAGGQVRKGETATLAVIYRDWTKQAEDSDGNKLQDAEGKPLMETVPMLRQFPVFNVSQCDSLSEQVSGVSTVTRPQEDFAAVNPEQLDQVLSVVNATGVQFSPKPQNRAYYRSVTDQIVMPLTSQFDSEGDYWSTVLHELVHASGHAKRLNREGITKATKQFGDPVYAFEELIAEIGSAFLCAYLGITGDMQHESYVEGWLSRLKSDKKALFSACRQAREASEYLLAPLITPS
jgi:antirestriction protein ArdC